MMKYPSVTVAATFAAVLVPGVVAAQAAASVPADAQAPPNTAPPDAAVQPAEPEQAPSSAQASVQTGPSEIPYLQRYLPEANLWELGLFGGVMFPSESHDLYDSSQPGAAQQPFRTAGELGVRFAYYPLAFLGAELEGAAMPSEADDGTAAGLWAGRGHLIGQLPTGSVVPFLLVGGGALGAGSDAMGTDVEGAVHFGVGAKAALGEHLLVRLDVRDTMSRKFTADSASDSGFAHSPEVLIGISFVPSRKKPDGDGDGVLDYRDNCPATRGAFAGCPAPDTDGDGVADDVDECVDVPGVEPSGCPDTDGDGVLDRDDLCPQHAGTGPGGCPEKVCPVRDADGDGLTDAVDECPQQAARTLTGCPAPERPLDTPASEDGAGAAEGGADSEGDGADTAGSDAAGSGPTESNDSEGTADPKDAAGHTESGAPAGWREDEGEERR